MVRADATRTRQAFRRAGPARLDLCRGMAPNAGPCEVFLLIVRCRTGFRPWRHVASNRRRRTRSASSTLKGLNRCRLKDEARASSSSHARAATCPPSPSSRAQPGRGMNAPCGRGMNAPCGRRELGTRAGRRRVEVRGEECGLDPAVPRSGPHDPNFGRSSRGDRSAAAGTEQCRRSRTRSSLLGEAGESRRRLCTYRRTRMDWLASAQRISGRTWGR